jgi:ketopantoate reductase
MESTNSHYRTAVVVGMGEMGGVFARALLKSNHIVATVTRHTDLTAASAAHPDPDVVLITVGESDLAAVLAALPAPWKRRAALLQNELLPRDWEAHGIVDPTVAVVWFEKKPGQDVKVIIPSPIGGPYATELSAALDTIGIPCTVVADADELTAELVTKNLYILTANIGGLTTGGTVDELWNSHRAFAAGVADEVLAVQSWLAGRDLDTARHIAGMEAAIAGDPDHGATGRSAPARLARALHNAAHAGIATPQLAAIAAEHNIGT